jgi:ATP-dependent helicase/nuclease subunit A
VEEQIPYLDAYSMRRMHSFLKIALTSSTGAAVHIERESGMSTVEQIPEEAAAAPTALPLCEAEVSRFVSRFTYTYAHENLASVPRKLSVSALKPTLLDEKMKAEIDPAVEGQDPYLQRGRTEEGEEEEPTAAPMLPAFMTGKREEESARRGIATHLFLQFCDFTALSERGAEAELDRLIREKFISEENGARVRLGEIEKFRKSRLLREILGACRLHREMRFHARMPAALFTESEEKRAALGEHRILVQGVIDCLYEDERGCLTLIDYKTDRLPREALSDPLLAAEILSKKHREQLSYYAIAVEQMFGKRPDRIRVYSLHLGDTVEIKPMKCDICK